MINMPRYSTRLGGFGKLLAYGYDYKIFIYLNKAIMSDLLSLTPVLYDYLKRMSLREHPVLAQLRADTQQLNTAAMQVTPEQGQFLSLLVKLIGAKKALEIGTYTGYSALCTALALPADGTLIACDINAEWTQMAKRYWEAAHVAPKIDLRLGDALTTLDELIAQHEAASFDFAFIDADKANYSHYYERAITLVRAGGLIVIDNVLWGGEVADPTNDKPSTLAIRALNKLISQDKRVDISMVPIGDGLTLARKI